MSEEKKELSDLEKRMAAETKAAQLEGQMKIEKEKAEQREGALKEALAMRGEKGKEEGEEGKEKEVDRAISSTLSVPVSVEPVRFRMGVVGEGGQAGQGGQGGGGQPTGQPGGNITQTVTAGPSIAVVVAIMAAIVIALIALFLFFGANKPAPTSTPIEQKGDGIYKYEDGILKPVSILFDLLSSDVQAEEKVVKVPKDVKVIIVDDKAKELKVASQEIEELKKVKATLDTQINNANMAVVQITKELSAARVKNSGQVTDLTTKLNDKKSELKTIQDKTEELQKQVHKMELDVAKEQGKTDRLEKVIEVVEGKTGEIMEAFDGYIPGEPPTALLRKIKRDITCPEGSIPKMYTVGENFSFSCEIPLEEPDALGSKKTSKYIKCLAWGAVTGAIGGGSLYGYARYSKNEFDLFDTLASSAASFGFGYGFCLLVSE